MSLNCASPCALDSELLRGTRQLSWHSHCDQHIYGDQRIHRAKLICGLLSINNNKRERRYVTGVDYVGRQCSSSARLCGTITNVIDRYHCTKRACCWRNVRSGLFFALVWSWSLEEEANMELQSEFRYKRNAMWGMWRAKQQGDRTCTQAAKPHTPT